ncbi:MAG: glycosyltransferase [Pseudomonadota bacterium]|nr:glycosyltransferase [Pseudomonadota bacterium]
MPDTSIRKSSKLLHNKQNICPVVFRPAGLLDLFGTAVTIQSLKENAAEHTFYDIYILLTNELDAALQKRLEDMADSNIKITLLPNMEQKYPDVSNRKLYVLAIPELLSTYKPVLYLAPSTLVLSDISELYTLDFGNKTIALCPDTRFLNTETETENYNTDVILFNTAYWKKHKQTKTCFKRYKEESLNYILKTVCKAKTFLLDSRWNIQCRNTVDDMAVSALIAQGNCNILNYSGGNPQLRPEIYLAGLWWEYARKTPFYELILYKNIQNIIASSKQNQPKQPEKQNEIQQPEKTAETPLQPEHQNFYHLVTTLEQDVNQLIFKKKKDEPSLYMERIANDDAAYSMIKQYIKLNFAYWLTGLRLPSEKKENTRAKLKKQIDTLQNELMQKLTA